MFVAPGVLLPTSYELAMSLHTSINGPVTSSFATELSQLKEWIMIKCVKLTDRD